MRRALTFATAGLLLLGVQVFAAPPDLGQGWSDGERQGFYGTSQGSQLLPYAWFMALERADSATPFAMNLDRFGYIANPESTAGLPVGFVVDKDPGGKWSGVWVGMTCAACHTSQLTYQGTTYRIDGGGTQADFYKFIAAVADALEATARDPQKFARFIARAKSDAPSLAVLQKEAATWRAYVTASTPTIAAWGPGRLDAFNMIFNRVGFTDLTPGGIADNSKPPNAPASYPHLWNTHWHDYVQWDASAPNNTVMARLGRNVGEVLGVFGHASVREIQPNLLYWRSTARRRNQLVIEEAWLSKLRAPAWPEALGRIDRASQAYREGGELYSKRCASCHALVTRDTENLPQVLHKATLSQAGTDPTLAKNNRSRRMQTGILAGHGLRPGLGKDHKLGAESCALDVVVNAVVGAILEVRPWDIFQLLDQPDVLVNGQVAALTHAFGVLAAPMTDPVARREREQLLADLRNSRRPGNPDCYALGDAPPELKDEPGYKARPLNGIWATGPYLHNGSVPTLDDLLKPPSERPKTFYVGNPEFDPNKVGYRSDSGPFLFDTAIPGNSNAGHDKYGTLTDEERAALLLYLKSL